MRYRYCSVCHNRITEKIKKTIFTKQAEVESAIAIANQQLVVPKTKVEELNLSGDDEGAATPREGKTEAF